MNSGLLRFEVSEIENFYHFDYFYQGIPQLEQNISTKMGKIIN